MEINVRHDKKAVVASITGKVDATNAMEMEKRFEELTNGQGNILVVNMKDLHYISSAGLRVILIISKKLKKRKGDILLVGLRGSVKEVFEISGFDSIYKIFDTEEAALAHV